MKLFGKDLDTDVAVVAEIGVNHEGDPEKASELLRLAAGAGADAVKFQSYTPSRFASANDLERLERVTRFGLSEADHRRLAAEAKTLGVVFFSTAVTEDWVPLIAELSPTIKIASGDLTFEPVIRAAARTGKSVIMSTGTGTIEEVDRAVDWFKEEVGAANLADRLLLMHCVSAYPVPIEDANVRTVPFFVERYGIPIGYSNHVLGQEAVLAAVALGACAIEVHFTDCKTGRTFRDHELSFEPDELKALIKSIGHVRSSLGAYDKQRQASEEPLVAITRKGLVAAHDLEAGVVLGRDDIMFARPATEFTSNELDLAVGRRLAQALKKGQLIPRTGVE